MRKQYRCRFEACEDDYRPVKFPPPGPFWCSGVAFYQSKETGEEFSRNIVIAYLDNEAQIKEYWPEAEKIDVGKYEEPVFTDRFPRPSWWKGEE